MKYKNIGLKFGPNILANSKDIRLGIYLTVPNENSGVRMEFKKRLKVENIKIQMKKGILIKKNTVYCFSC